LYDAEPALFGADKSLDFISSWKWGAVGLSVGVYPRDRQPSYPREYTMKRVQEFANFYEMVNSFYVMTKQPYTSNDQIRLEEFLSTALTFQTIAENFPVDFEMFFLIDMPDASISGPRRRRFEQMMRDSFCHKNTTFSRTSTQIEPKSVAMSQRLSAIQKLHETQHPFAQWYRFELAQISGNRLRSVDLNVLHTIVVTDASRLTIADSCRRFEFVHAKCKVDATRASLMAMRGYALNPQYRDRGLGLRDVTKR
jgi:hypothetical protein